MELNSKESSKPAAAGDTPAAGPAQKKRGIIRRLYDWTLHWAYTPYAVWALLGIAFIESSFFPIPPDVLLIAMALAAPQRALRYSAICTAGSVAGAFLGYAIGMFFFEAVGGRIIDFYNAREAYESIRVGFNTHGFFWVFMAALTPIPYKVFTIAAGVCELNLGVLLAASVLGRGLRFFAVGLLFKLFGPPIKKFIDRYFNLLTIVFFVGLVGGFILVKILWSGHEESPAQPAGGGITQEQPAQPKERKDKDSEAAKPTPGAKNEEPPPKAKEGEPKKEQPKEEKGMLSAQARKKLLQIARETVDAAIRGKPIPKAPIDDPELQGHSGAFVTLKTHDQLRGCIGRFVADQALWKTVREMAVASSTEDPRFWGNRLRPDEMKVLEIEISVLSPLQKIASPLDIELGKHGIYIRRGQRSGCFLPQVATETGWSKVEFLSHCCEGKAGLPADAWKDPKTDVFIFTAEIINEKDEAAKAEEKPAPPKNDAGQDKPKQ